MFNKSLFFFNETKYVYKLLRISDYKKYVV